MQIAARPYVIASAALAATGLVAVTPIAQRLPALNIVSPEVRLVDAGDSLLNIPYNLFQDIVNIPYNEVEAVNQFGNADLFGGTIFTASATNLFGEDPGDPGRFMSVIDSLFPFTAISGLGQPEIDPTADAAGTAGLSQQIALLIDAELPVSASSDADYSAPLAPVSEITGFTGIDRTIESLAILSGSQQFPLLNDFFQVPISTLESGYDFGNVVDPSAGVGVNGAVPSDAILGFPGTTPEMGDIGYGVTSTGQTLNVAGNPVELMPWANDTFTLNLAEPFQNFFTSLEAPIDTSGFDIPSLTQIGQAVQTFAAGAVVALDPFVPGSPVCPDTCGLADSLTQNALVQDIANLDPTNPSLVDYLNLVSEGLNNAPTAEQVAFSEEFLSGNSQSMFDIGNPETDMVPLDGTYAPQTPDPFATSPLITELTSLAQASGIQNLAEELASANGYTPAFSDVTEYLTPDGTIVPAAAATAGSAADVSTLSSSTADLSALLDLGGMSDLSSQLSTDLSSLVAELGATLPANLSALPMDLLSLF